MSVDTSFTKENLDGFLKELGKEYRKRSGKKIPAEIVLIGGAAILARYGFREMTNDVDAIVFASSAMKEAINNVGDRLGLPNDWLNIDFMKTQSFSEKLLEVSIYYKTYSNILVIRAVSAEYLIAMKLMSGREYKFDMSDIVGILREHEHSGKTISRKAIDKAVVKLYGNWDLIPKNSIRVLEDAFSSGDFDRVYHEIRKSEAEAKEYLLDFDKNNPGELKTENIDTILEKARENNDSFKIGLVTGNESLEEITYAFRNAVAEEIADKKRKGLPVARYDEKKKKAYLEYPDGRKEYDYSE